MATENAVSAEEIKVNAAKMHISDTDVAIDIIAVGGVSTGKDAQAALTRGAKAVQIGSALMKEGPGVFTRLQQELSAARTAQ